MREIIAYQCSRMQRAARPADCVTNVDTTRNLSMTALPIRAILAALCALVTLVPMAAAGEVGELRAARQYGIGYLQMMVMEHDHLIEKHAHAMGLPAITMRWTKFSDATGVSDALLSGNLDFAAGGLGSFITLWSRTRQNLGVKGMAALDSMPMLLNTNNPAIRDIRDFTADDRIAIAGVKVSSQATTLQYAAARTFGRDNWNRLDHLTTNLGHPTATQLLLQPGSGITAHFASPPFQEFELRQPGIHTVLDSYDVWGGPQTFILVWTTSNFRAQNPKLYAAIMAALEEATTFINHNRRAAAAIYLEMTGDTRMSVDDLVAILADRRVHFTLVPQNIVKFADFKAEIGVIDRKPASWQELFFPEIHALAGS